MPPTQTTYRIFNPDSNATQEVASFVNPNGGNITLESGVIYLKNGTYYVGNNVIVPSNTQIVGLGTSSTYIVFEGPYGFLTEGANIYTTGTVTVISGVNVTGSGTAWRTNVQPGMSIFIGTQWYPIAAVISDTQLVLGQSYGDDVSLPAIYRIANVTNSVMFSNLTIQASQVTGIAFSDSTQITLEDVQLLANNVGVSFTNCSDVKQDGVIVAASTSDGIQATNMGLCDWRSVNSDGNGGNGITFSNVKKLSLFPGDAEGNAGDGLNATSGVELSLFISPDGNGGNGITFVTGCQNCNIFNSGFEGNVGYGIDIEDASSANNIILGCIFQGNTAGTVNDSGTGTLIRSNIGISDN